MPKPNKLPRWADQDIVDPTSGVNNVVEPSEAKKNLGHGPLGEYPPRQYQNWFMRMVYLWIKFWDEDLNYRTGIFEVEVTTASPTITFKIRYERIGDIVNLIFPAVSCNLAGPINVFRLEPTASDFPPEVLPPSGSSGVINAVGLVCEQTSQFKICSMHVRNWMKEWSIGWPDNSGEISHSSWGNGTSEIKRGTLTYSVFDIEGAQ